MDSLALKKIVLMVVFLLSERVKNIKWIERVFIGVPIVEHSGR